VVTGTSLDGAAAKQWWSPLCRWFANLVASRPSARQDANCPGQAITSARPTDLVISRSRQQIDPSTHLARARGLEPLTRRLDVDVATSAHPDQPRMLAASKPPCQPTPDRPPARQVQARVAAGRFPATCTPVLSQQLVGRARSNDRRRCPQSPCPSSWLAWLVTLPADGWLASFDGACPQRSDHLVGGGFGHLDQRVPVGDLNRADVAATEP
jgi:hypothetical protein